MANSREVCAIVLAAGKGTRMKSPLPKVLHEIAGRPMLTWVIQALRAAGVHTSVAVVGGDLQPFQSVLAEYPDLVICEQKQRRGTADAVAAAWVAFAGVTRPVYADGAILRGEPVSADYVIVCNGDAPNLNPSTIRAFCDSMVARNVDLAVIGMRHPRPFGYGRIVQDDEGNLTKIVEEKDADEATRRIDLCNSGVVLGRTGVLFDLLGQVTTNNSQNEYYLTDCFALAQKHGKSVQVYETADWQGFEGINDPQQLAALSQIMQGRS